MNPYDQKAWRQIQERHERLAARSPRKLVPGSVKTVARDVVVRGKEGFEAMPASDQIQHVLADGMQAAASGIGAAASATVIQRLILGKYKRHGYELSRIAQIQELELLVSDTVFSRRKRLAYMSASAAEGGVAGAMTSVSTAGAVFGGIAGAGAGAVPGGLALAGVMIADAAATLGAACRVTADTAAHYGYDPNDPAEEIFMASILGVATAGSQASKVAAQHELNHVAGLLARRATKEALSKTNLARALTKVWPRLLERLTHRQMGKAVPLLGIAVGAGMNLKLIKDVADEAYFAYRERRLRESYFGSDNPPTSSVQRERVGDLLVLDLLRDDRDDTVDTRDAA